MWSQIPCTITTTVLCALIALNKGDIEAEKAATLGLFVAEHILLSFIYLAIRIFDQKSGLQNPGSVQARNICQWSLALSVIASVCAIVSPILYRTGHIDFVISLWVSAQVEFSYFKDFFLTKYTDS